MNCLPVTHLFRLGLILVLILLLPAYSPAASREVRIGIPDHRGPAQTLNAWQATADYLTATIPGHHFTIVPFDLDSIDPAIADEKLEFALLSPARYVKLAKLYRAQHLATLIRRVGNAESSRLGGVIFTRADRTDITTLADLKGKSLMATHETAFAGWQAAHYEMFRNGISPGQLKSLRFSGYPVDKVVMAVLHGEVDAGTVRTDILEQMAAEVKINLRDIRIINQQETPGFPFLHSTQLYPEYIFASMGAVDAGLSRKVAARLLLYPGDSRAGETVQIGGWTIPASNEDVRTILQAMRLPPYESFGKVAFGEAVRQHWGNLVAAVLVLILLTILVIRLKLATERVRHLTALEESSAAFNDVVSSQPAGIYRIRVKTADNYQSAAQLGITYEFVSDQYCDLVGSARETLMENPGLTRQLIHPDDYEGFITANLYSFRGNAPFVWEGRMTLKGETRWMHYESQPRELAGGDTLWTGFLSDITDRKQAEAEIARTNLKYRALFEDAGDYILVLSHPTGDQPPIIIDANTAALMRHGYAREELVGKSILFIDTPEAFEINRGIGASIMHQKGPTIFESVHRCKDGSTFPVEVSARLIQIGVDPAIVLCIERDITERKKAEDSLRRSEERFRVLFNKVANIAVQGYGPDGTVRFWNKASEELYGYSAAEAVGRNLLDLIIPPNMRNDVSDAIRFMFETGEGIPSDELLLMRKDGSLVPVYSNHTILDVAGLGKELYCIDIDLSERKKSAVRIEHLNRILRTLRFVDKLVLQEKNPKSFIEKTCNLLVEHRGYMSAMIIVMEQDWTPNLFAMSGQLIDRYSPDDRTSMDNLLPCCKEALRSDGALLINTQSKLCGNCSVSIPHSGDVICMALRYEGKLYGCIRASSAMINGIDGEEKELFEGLAADIAFALHAMEQEYIMGQIRAEKDQIEAEMRQSQKMEAVGRLAGGIAHDFNNKLTVIICGAELALSQVNPDSQLYNDLHNIRKAGEQSAALTRQLLAFSRKQFIEPEIISLNDVISSELEFLSRLISEEIDIHFIPAESRTDISMDPSQLDQILTNLAVNASDAINGTGIITIETSTVVINDPGRKGLDLSTGDYTVLTFSDNGSGMDEETQNNIFEPFFTTKPEGKGTGLGLSTVYGIVKQNHGAIHVESIPGKGTSFRLYFPRGQGKDKHRSEIKDHAIPVGVGTILIVEDNDVLLNLTETVLAAKGYRIMMAASPDEACRICETYSAEIHLLLTDIVMPSMNGKDLQGRIEAMRPGIKTIFMSGYTSDIISARGVDEETAHFLPKPFTMDALQQKVHTVLHGD